MTPNCVALARIRELETQLKAASAAVTAVSERNAKEVASRLQHVIPLLEAQLRHQSVSSESCVARNVTMHVMQMPMDTLSGMRCSQLNAVRRAGRKGAAVPAEIQTGMTGAEYQMEGRIHKRASFMDRADCIRGDAAARDRSTQPRTSASYGPPS